MNRVVLSANEAVWFSRNVLKSLVIMNAAAEKDPTIKDRRTYKTLIKISPQCSEENPPQEVSLTKKEKTVVYSMIDNTVRMLENTVLPKYQSQGLTKYIEDVEGKLELLKKMAKKFR